MRGIGGRKTHIDSDMAHDTLVMRQTNVLILVVNPICFDRTSGSWLFLLDDERALDVDFDGPGVDDCVL